MFKLLLKIILASAAISLLIKYGGPLLPIPATFPSALILILLPPSLMTLVFWRQARAEQSP